VSAPAEASGDEPIVLREARGDAALLTLNRPTRRNALTIGLVRAIADGVTDAVTDGARAVILTGAPPVFCAGGDMPELSGVAEDGALAVSDVIYGNFHRLVRTVTGAPVPVIAAVNGAAIGAGLDLALICDLRIASTEATFVSSWISVGLVPGMGGAFLLPHLVGSTRAAQALLLGTAVNASDALAWGLVNDVAAPDELLAAADAMAATVAKLPAVAVARTKAALRRSIDAGLEQELATLGATQGALLTGPAFKEATARFRR
jgi:2-(1,2-epoxy-1,2-dihydrophenyl)acetyl-CoA isomerase